MVTGGAGPNPPQSLKAPTRSGTPQGGRSSSQVVCSTGPPRASVSARPPKAAAPVLDMLSRRRVDRGAGVYRRRAYLPRAPATVALVSARDAFSKSAAAVVERRDIPAGTSGSPPAPGDETRYDRSDHGDDRQYPIKSICFREANLGGPSILGGNHGMRLSHERSNVKPDRRRQTSRGDSIPRACVAAMSSPGVYRSAS